MARFTDYEEVSCTSITRIDSDRLIAVLQQKVTTHYGSGIVIVGLDDPRSFTRTRSTYIVVKDKRVLALPTEGEQINAINTALRATEERDGGDLLAISQTLSNEPILSDEFEFWRSTQKPSQAEVDARIAEIAKSQRVCNKDESGALVPVEDGRGLPLYLSVSIIVFISFPFCLEMLFFELIVYIFLGLPIVLSYVNLD